MVVKAGQVADVVEAEAGGALERRAGDEQQRNDELRGHGEAKQGHRDQHHAPGGENGKSSTLRRTEAGS